MKCPQCGTENVANSTFCANCGAQIPAAQASYTPYSNANMPGASYQASYQGQSDYSSDYSMPSPDQVLVDKDEQVMATLKNGMALNYISGEGLRRERAFVTNKRLYYYYKQGVVNITNVEDKIDVEDITGTKICSIAHYGLLILAALFALAGIILAIAFEEGEAIVPFLVPVVAFVVSFFLTKKRHMFVEYAGGSIRFSVKGYSMKNVRDFQNMIFKVKDRIKGKK